MIFFNSKFFTNSLNDNKTNIKRDLFYFDICIIMILKKWIHIFRMINHWMIIQIDH